MAMSLFKFPADMQDSFLGNVIDYTVDDTPANEIELCNRRREPLEFDPLCTTKRVKKLFRVAIQ
jgi:hypothetical protein